MMKSQIIFPLVTIMTLTLALISSSYSVAWADSDKDLCYDQVGDDQFCFTTIQKCKPEQKHDEIAESPCYNEDR
jgi:hypothetical protein